MNTDILRGRRLGNLNAESVKYTASTVFDTILVNPVIEINKAHMVMLVSQGIVKKSQGAKCLEGLGNLKIGDELDPILEDVHMNVESQLTKIVGTNIGGQLNLGKSRNDQVSTAIRMALRTYLLKIITNLIEFRLIILEKAEDHLETIMPGYTHLKNAQPVSFAHYLLAYVEIFKRDKKRFFNNIVNLDECPLGVAALAGTSYNIDRNFTSRKLGFKKPTLNSIDTVSDRDFVLDFLSSAAICATHISRLAEDLIIWNSDIFNLINFNDRILTGSSIMPQKKNPDPAELIRGRAGKNFGNLQAMLTTMKGLPLSYYKDMQEDKNLVFDSYDVLKESILIANELIKNLNSNKQRMLYLANKGYTTATDFADYLVQKKNLSFREAYKISGKIVDYAEKNNKKLDELSMNEIKKVKKDLNKDVMKVFSVKNSVNLKTSHGGTSIKNIKTVLSKLKKEFK